LRPEFRDRLRSTTSKQENLGNIKLNEDLNYNGKTTTTQQEVEENE